MSRKLLFSFVLWTLGALIPSMAEQLTVGDGESNNNYVPIYGLYTDSYCKCEYVIASEDLAAMSGQTITSLTWYLQTQATKVWNAMFYVYLKEVDSTTLTAWQCTDEDLVFTGNLDGRSETITVEIDPYAYGGGNLLVGVYCIPTDSSYGGAYFYGMTVDGASIQGYSGSSLDAVSANQRNFLPKTTFDFDNQVVLPKPSGLTVSDITMNSASLSWTAAGGEDSWNVACKRSGDEEWPEPENVSTPGHQLTGLNVGTAYDVRVQSVYATGESAWIEASFATPVCSDDAEKVVISYQLSDAYGDGWNGAKMIVRHVNGAVIATLTLSNGSAASGTLELCCDETYEFVWSKGSYDGECGFTISDAEGTVLLEKEGAAEGGVSPTAGVKLEYTPHLVVLHKPTNLQATEVTYNSVTLTWTPGEDDPAQDAWVVAYWADGASEPSYANVSVEPTVTLDLVENTTYFAKVAAVSGQETSQWSDQITFSTPEQFPRPAELAVSDVKYNKAVIAWEGGASSYTLRYRPKALKNGFFEDFESVAGTNALPEGWTSIDADGDGNNWFTFTPEDVNDNYGNPTVFDTTCATSASYGSAALNPDNWLVTPEVELKGELSVWMRAQDPDWPEENFAIYACTAGNTLDDFDLDGVELIPETTSTGVYVKYTADLSEFGGELGWIAIRHFDCTDMFRLNVDNFYIQHGPEDVHEWVVVDNITANQYIIEGLSPETKYEVEVCANYDGGSSEWVGAEFTTGAPDAVPTDLEVAEMDYESATIVWEGAQDAYNLRYRTAAPTYFYDDFEDGSLSVWTRIDADADGNNWKLVQLTDGNIAAISYSYINGTGAVVPDNWLITPKVTLGGTLKYKVIDSGYNEVYGVYVSVRGTETSDFIELTGDLTPATQWTTETVDLSAYAGQEGYIAFRHYNCTDGYYMLLDDVGVYAPEREAGEWNDVPGIEAKEYALEGLEPNTGYDVEVQGIYSGDKLTDWSETLTFTTDKYYAPVTLAEALESAEAGVEYALDDYLAFVMISPDNQYIYATNGEGDWVRLAGINPNAFTNTLVIYNVIGTFSNLDVAPTLTLTDFSNIATFSLDDPLEIDNLDLTKSLSEPLKPCQVMSVTGYFDGQKLRAYSGENGSQGQGLQLSSTEGLEAGIEYDLVFAVQLKEPWESNESAGAPRRAPLGNHDAIDNVIAEVLSIQETDQSVTGIGDVKVDGAKGDVRYFDIMGRYIGKSLENAPSGLYIGSDGKKVRK